MGVGPGEEESEHGAVGKRSKSQALPVDDKEMGLLLTSPTSQIPWQGSNSNPPHTASEG